MLKPKKTLSSTSKTPAEYSRWSSRDLRLALEEFATTKSKKRAKELKRWLLQIMLGEI